MRKTSVALCLLSALLIAPFPIFASSSWTDLPLRPGAKIIYVSSWLGDDVNDGLTPSTPKRTLAGTPAPTPARPRDTIPAHSAR